VQQNHVWRRTLSKTPSPRKSFCIQNNRPFSRLCDQLRFQPRLIRQKNLASKTSSYQRCLFLSCVSRIGKYDAAKTLSNRFYNEDVQNMPRDLLWQDSQKTSHIPSLKRWVARHLTLDTFHVANSFFLGFENMQCSCKSLSGLQYKIIIRLHGCNT
jgi:hypothetical protein